MFQEIKYDPKDSLKDVDRNLEISIDALDRICEEEQVDGQLCYEAVFYIGKIISVYENRDLNIFLSKQFEDIFSAILYSISEIRSELDFKYVKIADYQANKETNINERFTSILVYMLYIMNKLCVKSVEFNLNFSNSKNGLKALFSFISDDKFMKKNYNTFVNPYSTGNINLIDNIVLNISCLSKCCDGIKNKWTNLSAVEALLKILKLKPSTEFYSYYAITNTATNDHIENISDIEFIALSFAKQLDICANDFENNRFNRKKKKTVEDDRVVEADIHCIYIDSICRTITAFLSGLYRFSINDKMKSMIYFDFKLNQTIKKLLYSNCNDVERKYVLKLVAQLSFNERICEDIYNDFKLTDYIKKYINNEKNDNSMRILCEVIHWNINNYNIRFMRNESHLHYSRHKHILFSCVRRNNFLSNKIILELESQGYKIHTNTEDATVDFIIRSIKDSCCVLACINENYRQTIQTQLESQYALKLCVPLISLILQDGYDTVGGWLGNVINDRKRCIDFTKENFDECIMALTKEINIFMIDRNKLIPSNEEHKIKPAEKKIAKGSKIETMTEMEVKEWFIENNINRSIVESLSPCDGMILKQICELKLRMPEFFFQLIYKVNHLDLRSVAVFNASIEKLIATDETLKLN